LNYIDRGGEQVYVQPFDANGIEFYGFLLPADPDILQKNLCDKYFNEPSGGKVKFRPAGPFVLLVFCKLNSLISKSPPYDNYGWYSEQEAAVWVLTIDETRNRLFWAFPYIWVDNALAMSMGREIYGFPKGLGWFQMPDSPASADMFTMDTLALKTLDSKTQGVREQLMKVERVVEGKAQAEWGSIKEGGEAVLKSLGMFAPANGIWDDLELIAHSLEDLIPGNCPFVFLKQFRDIADGYKACYQSIVEVPCKMTNFYSGGFLPGQYEVTFADFASHPIVKDLGLSGNVVQPVLSYWTKFDFVVGNGTEIWKGQ